MTYKIGLEVAVAVFAVLLFIILKRMVCSRTLFQRLNQHSESTLTKEMAEETKDSTNASANDSQVSIQLSTTGQDVTTAVISRRFSVKFDEEIESIVVSHRGRSSDLVEMINDLCFKNYEAASAIYFKSKSKGIIDFASPATAIGTSLTEVFLNLSLACIRVGTPHFIFKYLSEMDQLLIPKDAYFFNSIMKLLTMRKHYKIALSLHDVHMNTIGLIENSNSSDMNRSIYSCLLYCSLEAKESWRSTKFFKQLTKTCLSDNSEYPSEGDYRNLVRAVVVREDWVNGFKLIIYCKTGQTVSPRQLQAVESLFEEMFNSGARDRKNGNITGLLTVLVQIVEACASQMQVLTLLIKMLMKSGNMLDLNAQRDLVEVIMTRDRSLMDNVSLAVCGSSDLCVGSFGSCFVEKAFDFTIAQCGSVSAVPSTNWITLVNCLLQWCVENRQPIDSVRRQLLPLFRHMFVSFEESMDMYHDYSGIIADTAGYSPDLTTYRLLFEFATIGNEHTDFATIVEIYKIFENQYESGLIVPNGLFYLHCLQAVLKCIRCDASSQKPSMQPENTVLPCPWTFTRTLLSDMVSVASVAPTAALLETSMRILGKCIVNCRNTTCTDQLFQNGMDCIRDFVKSELKLQPTSVMYMPLVEAAITVNSRLWTQNFIKRLAADVSESAVTSSRGRICLDEISVKSSKSSHSGFSTSDSSERGASQTPKLTAKETAQLLVTCAERNPGLFETVLDLILLCRFPLGMEAFTNSAVVSRLSAEQKLNIVEIAHKHKFKITPAQLQCKKLAVGGNKKVYKRTEASTIVRQNVK